MKREINKILKQLGLNDIEKEVYLTTFEYGPAPASIIAKSAGLNRVTVYEALKRLSKMGYIKIRAKKDVNVKNFEAEDINVIKEKLIDKLQEVKNSLDKIEQIKPVFESIYHKKAEKPEVYFFEGKYGIKNVLNDTIKQKPKESIAFASADYLDIGFDKKFLNDYWHKRVALKIPARGIMPDTKKARAWFTTEKNQKELRKIKFIPAKYYDFKNEIEIYGNNIAIISMEKNNEHGVIVRSKSIAESLRSLFDFIWNIEIK